MTRRQTLVIADRFSPEALGLLKKYDFLDVHHEIGFTHKSPLAEKTDALIIRSKTRINDEFLERTPQLRVIVTATNGFDHIDLASTASRGISVFYCPDGNTASAAELTWALILACARRVVSAHLALQNKNWSRDAFTGVELSGKTLGVIGLGRVGRRVARVAHAFSMNVMAYDPYVEESVFETSHATRAGLVEVLRQSDVVTIHVPYTRETHHMINRMTLSEMQTLGILINTSRGSVVSEQDLAEFLAHGELGAAGLDVFEREPLSMDSSLLRLKNIVLTPHIGALTEEAFQRVSLLAAEKIVHFFSGQSVAHRLPPQDLWYTHPKGFN